MCGINGIAVGRPITEGELEKRVLAMNHSIAHRGPDSAGISLFGAHDAAEPWSSSSSSWRLGLGHRRLSIIDTSSLADQPMTSASGRWVMVFNGEIYNFRELRSELDRAYAFRTASDTETILAWVDLRGLDSFLQVCNGMFAIALLDRQEGRLHLVRDRLGIKPLYYHLSDDGLVFSSEIKGILASGLVEALFNEPALDEYLAHRHVREPWTFFKGIRQVESGVWLNLNLNTWEMKRTLYWDFPPEFNRQQQAGSQTAPANGYDHDALCEAFSHELEKAVKRRLISDVPLGTYLSGGLDSSVITALTALGCGAGQSSEGGAGVNTYNIGFSDLNEFSYARMVSQRYGTRHHEILTDMDSYLDSLERVISFRDAPLGVPNEVPLAHMSEVLKRNITVVLSGEGADELLGGYGRIFRTPWDYEAIRLEGREWGFHDGIRGIARPDQDISGFYLFLMDQYEYVPRNFRDGNLCLDRSLRRHFDQLIGTQFSARGNSLERHEESVFRFFHNWHVKGLLHRLDATTMLAGVEARVPFMDHELIEFVYRSVPFDMKLRWNDPEASKGALKSRASEYSEKWDTPKYILKRAAEPLLPREVIYRPKVGFPVPLNHWSERLSGMGRELVAKAPWFTAGSWERFEDELRSFARADQILWMLINAELFRRQYFGKQWRW